MLELGAVKKPERNHGRNKASYVSKLNVIRALRPER